MCLSSVPPPNLGCQWWYKAMFSQALSGVLIVSVLLGNGISTSRPWTIFTTARAAYLSFKLTVTSFPSLVCQARDLYW